MLVGVLACPCGGLWAIVGDISEREGIVALLVPLELPTEAPPIARARSSGFGFACSTRKGVLLARPATSVARTWVRESRSASRAVDASANGPR
ncbi:MAG: hypothetical protein JWM74_5166, partial [Myxococcaceae bacterium]|nr:hypothetical protein [Myxococcaceae bacterium]